MAQSIFYAHARRACAAALAATAGFGIATGAVAQIRTDASLAKPAQSLSGPNYLIPETLGRLAGRNLFHSFQTFNINFNESANFTTVTPALANVISRVTGGTASQINGLLKLTPVSGAPNFFFINPAGVVFGAGALIDVPGAFHVSTANYISFPDGRFHADLSRASTFSSAAPEAFGFLGTTRAPITIRDGAVIATQLQPISVIAGDVEISNAAAVMSLAGDIRVGAVGSRAREIAMSGPLPALSGNLTIRDGGAVVSQTFSPDNAGPITIGAGNVIIDGQSSASAGVTSLAAFDSGNGASITIAAAENLSILRGGFIQSATQSPGSSGSLKVSASNIAVDGQGIVTGIFGTKIGDGSAGAVKVSASGNLSILAGGQISSTVVSSGNAAALKVSAGGILIDGQGGPKDSQTGIVSNIFGAPANAAAIDIAATGDISIINGGFISSSTVAGGNAGSVKVTAANVRIDGRGIPSGILSEAENSPAANAGAIELSITGDLLLANGGFLSSSTLASGNAGSIKVTADAVRIDGQGNTPAAGIGSLAVLGARDAGVIEITAARDLSIVNGGFISSASAFGSGNAGSIRVSAANIRLDGPNFGASIFSDVLNGSTGNAGVVEITARRNLSIGDGGQISSSTSTSGAGGLVKVRADSINIDGRGNFAGIYSTTDSSGNAGAVEVSVAGNLSMANRAEISSSTFASGNGGSVKVTAENINIDGQGRFAGIFSDVLLLPMAAPGSASGNAGAVEVSAARRLSIFDGGAISSSTFSSGRAGAVTVNAGVLSIDGTSSSISASARAESSGQTGSVSVTARESIVLSNRGTLSIQNDATVGDPRSILPTTLSVSAPDITLQNAQITAASTGNVPASNILLRFANRLWLDPSSITTSANLGNGGSIDIGGGKLIVLDNSQITTSVLGPAGNGGNISVGADTLVMNTGFIQANTAAANASGGLVNVNVQTLAASGNSLFVGGEVPFAFQPGVFGFNVIQAAAPTGVGGTVLLTSPVLDIYGTLRQLNAGVIAGALGRTLCQTSGGSSLAPSGRGGLPPSARDLLRADPALPPSVAAAGLNSVQLAFAASRCF